MRKIILIAALLSGASALARGSAGAGPQLNVSADGQAMLSIRINNAAVSLRGRLDETLASSDGRILADCSAIGQKFGELCLIHQDGGDGRLALFKAAGNRFVLANNSVVLANNGDTLDRLAAEINGRAANADQAMAALNAAMSKSTTVAQLENALMDMPQNRVQLSDAGGQPLPPPVAAPPPVNGCCATPGGYSSTHKHHEEHHDYVERHDSVVDSTDTTGYVPVIEEEQYNQSCVDGACVSSGAPMPPPGVGGGVPPQDIPPGIAAPGVPAPPIAYPGPVPAPAYPYYGPGPAYYPYPPSVNTYYYRRGPVRVVVPPRYIRRR